MNERDPASAPEQQVYARWLDWGTRIGLALLGATFLIYACSLVEPLVPMRELAAVWNLPVERYLAVTGAPSGWAWLTALGKADFLNLAGVALLAMVTVACYLRIVPILAKHGALLEAGLAILQIVVLLLAASGTLAGAH